MGPERGSAALSCLAACLLISMAVHLLVMAVTREQARVMDDIRGYQLRTACSSAFASLPQIQNAYMGNILHRGILRPGSIPFLVSADNEYSDDGSFSMLKITASCENGSVNAVQKLSRLTMHPDRNSLMPDPDCCIAGREVEGSEYAEGKIYTGTGKVQIPSAAFLEGRCISALNPEELRLDGFAEGFYYLSSFRFPDGRKFPGNAAVIAESGIDVGSGSSFPGRVILFAGQGDINIGSGAEFDCALIIAAGNITIESGCRIQGAVCSGRRIILKGPSVFIPDENAVAPFSSAVSMT